MLKKKLDFVHKKYYFYSKECKRKYLIGGMKMDLNKLKEPFPLDVIEWRIQRSRFNSKGEPEAYVIPYVQKAAILDRLDTILGPANWKNEEFKTAPCGGLLCGLSIKIDNEWITKWDGAENTNIESVKGGLTDSLKRVAKYWGIGRYLDKLPSMKAVFRNDGRYIDNLGNKGKPQYFRWNPPKLPGVALPKEEVNV